jgi:hypothetical protein
MFSVICVFNDEKALELNLLQSLNLQKTSFELILVDNRVPSPLTKALNGAALKARGEFLMFVHQDVKLTDENWLGKAERFLGSLKDLGAAGVAGIDHKGYPRGFIVDRGKVWGRPIKLPIEVMTLDEQLLITPTSLFEHLKFDEGFKFHSYVADYCLRAYLRGLKTYVLPLSVHHNSSTAPILNIGRLEEDDLRLALKHKDSFAVIHKTTGTVSLRLTGPYLINTWKNALRRVLNKAGVVVLNLLFGSFQNVLDVGTVPITQPFLLNFLPRLAHSYSVGVSEDVCFIHASKRIRTHKDYVLCSLTHLPFKPKAFDLCIVWSLLEYLHKDKGKELLKNLEEIGKAILIRCPNNGAPLNEAYCLYLSKYSVKELKDEGFMVLGKGSQLRKAEPLSTIFAAFLPYTSVELIGLKRKR